MTISEKRARFRSEIGGLSCAEMRRVCFDEGIPVKARMTRLELTREIVESRLAPEIWKDIEGRREQA